MNILLGVIVGLLILMLLVTAHEFGHFIAARRNGVKVLEFGICFPPRAIAWKKGKDGKWHRLPKSEWDKPQDSLIFSLNWLPIGGFCQMDGESAEDKKKGTFGNASFLKKTKILFAGVGMNWLAAFLILTVLAWTGMPTMLNNQFTVPADTHIVAITDTSYYSRYTWSAPIVGAGLTIQLTGETFKGLGEIVWSLISGVFSQFSFDQAVRESGQQSLSAVGESVAGPVGIVGTIFPASVAGGPTIVAFLAALISISLACMNVLPIPALDGGRWFMIALYKIRKKTLSPEKEQRIIYRTFVILLALIVIITILDIRRFF